MKMALEGRSYSDVCKMKEKISFGTDIIGLDQK